MKSPAERVKIAEDYLRKGTAPEQYLKQMEGDREDLIRALKEGEARIEERNGMAIITGTHRSLVDIGYRFAPIVIAQNPQFWYQGGEPHTKYTVCQYTDAYLDLVSAVKEIASLEPGWGGSPTIIGSPQGVNSNLSLEMITATIEKYKKDWKVE